LSASDEQASGQEDDNDGARGVSKLLRLVWFSLHFPVYASARASLDKSQWLSAEEVVRLQQRKLSRLVRYAYRRVPYYRRLFDRLDIKPGDIRSGVDLSRIPVLTKEDIARNAGDLVSRGYPRLNLFPYSTGGSTGVPTRFFHDLHEMAWVEAAVHRTYAWAGWRRGHRLVLVSGLPAEMASLISIMRKWQGQSRFSLFGADTAQVDEVIAQLKRLSPRGLKGYATWLNLLAERIEATGGCGSCRPKYVISSSELLTRDIRERIGRVFGVAPFDNYSSREFMIAAECERHQGLHIAAENVVLETVRGVQPVPEGTPGEILITDLNRFGMPLIRYQIGDVGVLSSRRCPCGRGLPLLDGIVGRVSEFIRTPDGKYMAAPAIAHIFKDLKAAKYRIVQEVPEEITVKIVKGDGWSERDERAVANAFAVIRHKIKYVPDLETIGSGKNTIIQSRVKCF